MSRRLFSTAQIEQALRKSAGVQARAAELLEEATGIKCSRKVINDAVKHHPELQQAIKENEEASLDLAETRLLQAIDAGDIHATRFYLETRGRNRDYTRKVYQLLSVDPRRLTDAELDRALADMEKLVIDLGVQAVAEPQRALPAPTIINRPRD